MQLQAPAKLNLCLYLGGRRDDGLHELCSLFEPVDLSDLIEIGEAERDEVECPGLDGENLAARALEELRRRGWGRPPMRVAITKRIPVAAGLGGASADAAALLRLARCEVAGVGELARSLGADVPSQLSPALSLVGGAGELVERLPDPAPHAVVLLPGRGGLSTASVFAEADRLGLGRTRRDLGTLRGELRAAAGGGASPLEYRELLRNDLEPAAVSLRPEVEPALEALRAAGAAAALITGSGPTAFGLFADLERAEAAAAATGRPDAIACEAGVPR